MTGVEITAASVGKKAAKAAVGVGLSWLGGRLMGDTQKRQYSDPDDLRYSASTYGKGITELYGTKLISANGIWLKNNMYDELWQQSGGGGKKGKGGKGKAGGGGYMQRRATYAMGLCAGPAVCVRIMADTTTLYDARGDSLVQALAAGLAPVSVRHAGISITVYPGTDTQQPDARIEADLGVEWASAFRYTAYAVFDDHNLEEHGNRIPNLKFEMVSLDAAADLQGFQIPSENDPSGFVPETDLLTLDPYRPVMYRPLTDGIEVYDLYSKESMRKIILEPQTATIVDDDDAPTLFEELTIPPINVATLFVSSHIGVDVAGNFYLGAGKTLDGNNGRYFLAKWDANGKAIGIFQSALVSAALKGGKFQVFDGDFFTWNNSTSYPFTNLRIACQHGQGVGTQPVLYNADNPKSWLVFNGVSNTETGHAAYRPPLDLGELLGEGGTLVHVTRGSSAGDPHIGFYKVGVYPDLTGIDLWATLDGYDLDPAFSGLNSNENPFVSYVEEIDRFLIAWRTLVHKVTKDGVIEESALVPEGGSWLTYLGPTFSVMRSANGYYFGAIGSPAEGGTGRRVAPFNVFSWEFETPFDVGGAASGGVSYEPWTGSFISGRLGESYRGWPRGTDAQRVPVATIIADLYEKKGLSSADYDVSLLTDDLRGFPIGSDITAENVIKPLLTEYQIGHAHVDGKDVFTPLSNASAVRVIGDDDFATDDDETPETLLDAELIDPMTLPAKFEILFSDPARDYDINVASSPIDAELSVGSDAVSFRSNVVMDYKEATEHALNGHRALLSASKNLKWATGPKHRDLAPNDVITLTRKGRTYPFVRIEEITYSAGGFTEFKGVAFNPLDFNALVARPALNTTKLLTTQALSTMAFLDTHLLRPEDDNAGHYLAAGRQNEGASWFGAILWSSADRVTWEGSTAVRTSMQWGMVSDDQLVANDAFYGGEVTTDRKNTITIAMANGAPASISYEQLLGYSTVAAYECNAGDEWEFIMWEQAADNGDGTFTLSGIVRGMFGTEHLVKQHDSFGQRFIIMEKPAMARILGTKSALRYWYANSVGSLPIYDPSTAHTNTGRGQRTWSPCLLSAIEDGSNNIDTAWERRTRHSGEWADGTDDVPLNEDFERYRVQVRDTSGTVIREVTVNDVTTWQYTIADRTTDSTHNSATYSEIIIGVAQVSAAFGVGVERTITFDLTA